MGTRSAQAQLQIVRRLGKATRDCASGAVGVRTVAIMEAGWRSVTWGGGVADL